jgi:glycine dehydrogenase subunit 1
VTGAFDAPRFHEAVVLLDRPVAPVLAALAERGMAAGLDLAPSHPELGPAMLVCATETKTHADIETYERALRAVLAMPHDVRGAA